MPTYEVWASNSLEEWTHRFLETEDKDLAKSKAQQLFDSGRFQFIAIDQDGRTIWSNDPDTPAEMD